MILTRKSAISLCFLLCFSSVYLLSQETIWQNVSSPHGGVITSLAIDSSGAVLMGTFGGGVWRSTDKRDQWSQQKNGLSHPFVQQLLVMPSGEVIATTSKGIFSSNDLCQSWEKDDAPDSSFHQLVGDSNGRLYTVSYHGCMYTRDPLQDKWRQCLSSPKFEWGNPFRLIVNTNGHIFLSSNPTGMFRSTDHGNTWVSINRGLDTTIMGALSHNRDGELFTSVWNKGIYRSVNDGETWQKIDTVHKAVTAIAFAQDGTCYLSTRLPSQVLRFHRWGSPPETLPGNASPYHFEFARTGEIYALDGSTVFRLSYSGKSWQVIAREFSDIGESDFKIDDQQRLYALDENDNLFRTNNDGLTWEPIGAMIDMMTAFAVGPANQMFAKSFTQGFFLSTDDGQHWKNVARHTVDTMTTNLAIARDGTIFAGARLNTYLRPRKDGRGNELVSSGGGIYFSSDGGVSWELSGFPGLMIGNIRNVGEDVYAIVWDAPARLYRLKTRTEWVPLGPPDGDTFSVEGRDTIYIGTYNGVYASFDAGLHFEQIINGLTSGNIQDIAIAPGRGVFAITKIGMYFLPNGTQTWRAVESPRGRITYKLQVLGKYVYCDPDFGFRLDEEGSQNGIYRANIDTLLRTLPSMPAEEDFWVEASPSELNAARKMQVDRDGRLFVASGDSLFRSSNEGATWDRLSVRKARFGTIESFCLQSKRNSLYLVQTDSISMSSDGGDSWIGISAPMKSENERFTFLRDIAVWDNNTIALSVDIDFGKSCVFFSSDAGSRWARVPGTMDRIQCLQFHPEGDLFVGCIGQVYRVNRRDFSIDSVGGALFDPKAFYIDNICWDEDHAIRCLASDAGGTMYASRNEYLGGALFQSENEGRSWHRLSNIGNSIRAVLPTPGRELFVATNIGVFRSADGGTTWLPLSRGLTDGDITTLVLHPNGHLFAGTASGKIFKSIRPIATHK